MARQRLRSRGVALVTVLLATALLLALVAVMLAVGTVSLQRSAADARAVQAAAGTDAAVAWARGVLREEHGDVSAALERLGTTQGRRRLAIDASTVLVLSVSLLPASAQAGGDHLDANLQENPKVGETPVQLQVFADVIVDGREQAHRSETALLRVFPARPNSEIVGVVDDDGPVGVDSPGDAAGQIGSDPYTTELLVNAYTTVGGSKQSANQFGDLTWSDGNDAGGGPLP